jgi:hypothetical protein
MLTQILNRRRVLRKFILIFVILCLASSIYAQENWGWPQDIVPESWHNICQGTVYGFQYPSISSNDSLIFVSYYCLDSSQYFSGIGYSEFFDGQWQPLESFPIQVEWEYPIPLYYYDQDDTLLYFSMEMPGGYGGTDIWASQLINNTWSQPFNLGPVINSTGIETSPSLPNDDSRLYFSRSGTLMYSDKINGQYDDPVALPNLINTDLTENHPRISRDGQRLYFNRYGLYYRPDTIMVSYFSNGQWQEPFPLNGNINCNHYNQYCAMIPCSSYGPSFSGDGAKMYYTHFSPWGMFCDPIYEIWVSELVTDIGDESVAIPSAFSLSAYPNPFNSATNIAIEGNLEAVSEIAIYDITGRRIKSFAPASLITWDGTDRRGKPVSSGIYFVKVGAGNIEKSLRITFLK